MAKKDEKQEQEVITQPVTDKGTHTFPCVLRASTPEALSELLDNLTAPEGATLYTGCIARDMSDGQYIIRVDIKPS